MVDVYRIRIKKGDIEVEVEGDKEFVEKHLENLKKELQKFPLIEHSHEESKIIESQKKPYIKEFIKEKKPSGALKIAVTLAYYLTKYEGKKTFTQEDIKKAWIASGQKIPKKIWQAVIDGKNRYQWFEEVSRGEYKLSPHGVYFVENELPYKRKSK